MSVALGNLVRLTKADIKPAAAVLANAFHDYPVFVFFMPDGAQRSRKQPLLFRSLVRSGIMYGEAYATSRYMEGVAVWVPSDNRRQTLWSYIVSGQIFIPFIVGMETVRRQKAFGEYAGEVRKRVVPGRHWYLQVLGVDPTHQGKGFSGRLLKPMLIRADREGLPCYLETQAEKNVALYEHFGFRVAEEGIIPGSNVRSWAMVREGGKG